MAFPDAWLNELIAKNDIVAVISQYTELKPKGRRLWGLCPLHGEKTPSFSVSPDKQLFYCFGCHAGGSVIQFIMEMERLSFLEAVKMLAERVGMELPDMADDAAIRRDRAYRDRLYSANKYAARYFMETLLGPDGVLGRQYLAKRGLSSEEVKRFGIGYSVNEWDGLKRKLSADGFTQKELVDAGLLVENAEKKSVYDAFRGRVMFPIQGANGRVLGFGARTLGDEKPKYINTGDTLLYNKRNNLYGLNLLRGSKLDEIIVVEGYMDVIGLFESGVTNAVASLGTALTAQQARLIKRYVSRVLIAYDGDAAGQNATLRGLDILSAEGLDVRVIVFPDDLDPDEFVRARGKDAFDRLKDEARSLNAFKLESMAGAFKLENLEDREQYAKKACAFIAALDPVERDRHIEALARRTGYSLDALTEQCRTHADAPARKSERGPGMAPRRKARENVETERMRKEAAILFCMLQSKDATAQTVALGGLDCIETEAYQNFALAVIAAYAADGAPNAAALIAGLPKDQAELITGMLKDDAEYPDPVAAAVDCIGRIRAFDLNREKARLNERLADGTLSAAERDELLKRIQELNRKHG